LTERLKDPHPEIRTAAADAIGIVRRPSYSIASYFGFWIVEPLQLATNPPINLHNVVSPDAPTAGRDNDIMTGAPVAVDESVRDLLQKMMIDAQTPAERQAAARTIANWPPHQYQLRVSEWGVSIDNHGQMALSKSVLDEIPPFVHSDRRSAQQFQRLLQVSEHGNQADYSSVNGHPVGARPIFREPVNFGV